jgi:iron(III) transport system permease protein
MHGARSWLACICTRELQISADLSLHYRERSWGETLLRGLTLAFALALLALPLFGLLFAALEVDATQTWRGFLSHVLPGYLWNAAQISVGVALGTVALGAGAAWIIERYQFVGRNTLAWALMLPLAIPAYVSAYAFTDALAFAGPVQSALRSAFDWRKGDYWFFDLHNAYGAIFVFTFALYPYVYFLARDAFAERGLQLVDAARTLGLTPKEAWWRVALPVARPAVIGGALLAVMESLADYGAVSYLNVETLTVGIFRSWFNAGNKSAAAQLAILLLLFVTILMFVEHRARRRARFAAARVLTQPRRERVTGLNAAWLFGLCALPVIVGFALPVLLLLRLLLGSAEPIWTTNLARAFLDSLQLGGLVAAISVLLVLAMALLLRRAAPGGAYPFARGLHRGLSVAYAVPGAVLAVGLLTPFGAFDQKLPSLVFTGTLIAVTLGCVIRFYGVAANGIDAALARIPKNVDDAARVFGVRGWDALKAVYFPLLKRASATAALLVFVGTLKELPATLSLRPFNFDTLATYTYTLTKDERLAEAAAPSLLIIALALVPMVWLGRGNK